MRSHIATPAAGNYAGNRSQATSCGVELPAWRVATLFDKAIRSALKTAAETGNARKIADGAGLHLEVRPTGAGWWRLRYRFGGKEGMLSLGTYPEVGLALARQRRNDAREQIAAGVDPSADRKVEKAAKAEAAEVARIVDAGLPAPGTFEAVAREWLT